MNPHVMLLLGRWWKRLPPWVRSVWFVCGVGNLPFAAVAYAQGDVRLAVFDAVLGCVSLVNVVWQVWERCRRSSGG